MTDADQPPALSAMADIDRSPSPAVSFAAAQETNHAQQDATERLEETMERHEETTQETHQGWDRIEMAAIFTVVAVLTAACGWSAIALHGLAQQSGTTSWLAWGAPIIVDGPLFQSAIALVVLKRRAQVGVPVEARHKGWFWGTLAASELISLIGNGAHAAKITTTPLIAAVIAGMAPIAAMAVMHGFTILIEVPRKPGPTLRAGNPERITAAADFGAAQVLTPAASPGDGSSSPAVSSASPARLLETPQETMPVSYPSPGDARGDDQPAEEETAESAEQRDAAVWALHREGKSLREIAETTGLSKGYVGKILARLRTENSVGSGDPAAGDGAGVMLQIVR